jgi:hypothetical protein
VCGEELDRVDCDRCGGEGFVEYMDAPDTWGEDSPSEENHLVTCPDCRGSGGHLECPNAGRHPATTDEVIHEN